MSIKNGVGRKGYILTVFPGLLITLALSAVTFYMHIKDVMEIIRRDRLDDIINWLLYFGPRDAHPLATQFWGIIGIITAVFFIMFLGMSYLRMKDMQGESFHIKNFAFAVFALVVNFFISKKLFIFLFLAMIVLLSVVAKKKGLFQTAKQES